MSELSLFEKIKIVYPELTDNEFLDGSIKLQNDSDGVGDYIAKWEYEQPIPDGLTLGKPTASA
jgi:hypothetical protein